MQIIPAIDIRAGRCVRLLQGDYGRETVFSNDPIEVAQRWLAAGARLLHVVDLDGARGDHAVNRQLVRSIAQLPGCAVELGGGMKSATDVVNALRDGVKRVVLGTLAVQDRDLTAALIREHGESIAVGIDARDGKVAVRGWTEDSGLDAFAFAQQMQGLGAARIIFTDIERDGMLNSPNLSSLQRMIDTVDVPVIASGGVAHTRDLLDLARLGCEAAIVGKALYTGDIELESAIRAMATGDEYDAN